MAQLWGGRFTKETDQLVYNFSCYHACKAGDFDRRRKEADYRRAERNP